MSVLSASECAGSYRPSAHIRAADAQPCRETAVPGRLSGDHTKALIVPFVDVLHRVSLRIVTMPLQSQGIITRDNVSVDVSAVAYYRVVDAVKSVIAVENVGAAINQIVQTTLRKVVGQHTLDETLSETDSINIDIREILDFTTADWGVEVTLVELKDIQLPESMKRAMARQAEAGREKRAKIISAEGESMAAAANHGASVRPAPQGPDPLPLGDPAPLLHGIDEKAVGARAVPRVLQAGAVRFREAG